MQTSKAQPASLHLGPGQVVPGPHICNQIGHNVLGFLKALLSERCDSGGGSLSKSDIVRILDQLSTSTRLFPMFEAAYTSCDQTRRAFHGTSFNRETLPRFIILALFRDAIQLAFHSSSQSYDHSWQSTFASALLRYLEHSHGIAISERLLSDYRRLSAKHGAAFGPAMLLEDEDIIATAGAIVTAIASIQADGDAKAADLEAAINRDIADAFQLAGSSRRLITAHSLALFLDIAHQPSLHNRFRTTVSTQMPG